MPLRTWTGSAFTTAKSARVWNGSTWVNAKSGKVWNGSAWVNFLSSVNVTNQSFRGGGGGLEDAFAEAGYTLYSDGVAEGKTDGNFFSTFPISGEWFVGGVITDFSVRATINTLNLGNNGSYNGTFGSWLTLGTTNRTWEVSTSASGEGDYDQAILEFTIELAYTDDTTKIIDSAVIYLSAIAQTA